MLPESLQWIVEAFEPEGDPFVFLQIARDLEAQGNLEGAATVYDRAYGLDPDSEKIRDARKSVLDRLAVVEHGLTFRYVPAGPFLMGSREGEPDEQPLHPVWLSAYWLSETPLSWVDYCRLLGWSAPPEGLPASETDDRFLLFEGNKIRLEYCGALIDAEGSGTRRRYRRDTEGRRYDLKPMVSVGWQDAEHLSSHLSGFSVRFGLPSEAQWEKAARGGLIGARYGWGDAPATTDNCDFNNFHGFEIKPMKHFAANGYGLYAMNGGVWEWTADWYDAEYYRDAPPHDPAGPAQGKEKVVRGGSWSDCAETVTNSFRSSRSAKNWRNWRDDQPSGWGGQHCPNVSFRLCRRVTAVVASGAA
jgi:formylglycine-generating enzyme required for sulfatase activity